MIAEPTTPEPFQSSRKPYWTGGKIVALVLVVVLVVGVSGFAGFNYLINRTSSPSGSSNTCTNGGTNYPSCNRCPSGQTFFGRQCYSNCTNGATNPPACNNNICSNGANNFPQCTASACSDPASIISHVYNSYRLLIVKRCIDAFGTVDRVIQEADGDIHMRLSLDQAYSNLTNSANDQYQYGDLVVEIICVGPITQADAVSACQGYTNNIPLPDVGKHIIVSGPYVLDTEHYNSAEIHPVYSLNITGPSLGATVNMEENLDISYPNGATNGWLGPSPRTVVTPATVGNGNQFAETLSLYSISSTVEQITSITISTPGFSIVNVFPGLPVSFDPGGTVILILAIQAPDAYYHGLLDVQIVAT